VFLVDGEMRLLRQGESFSELPMTLRAVDSQGVLCELQLASGQVLSLSMVRAQSMRPMRVLREFEQSLSSQYQSADPGEGSGHGRR
jgi:hypothetical protein